MKASWIFLILIKVKAILKKKLLEHVKTGERLLASVLEQHLLKSNRFLRH